MTEQTDAPTWPEDPGWRIRTGAALIRQAPISDEMALAHAREDEREARQAKLDAQMARERAVERRWELERRGFAMRSSSEVFAQVAAAQDRTDRREARSAASWEASQINPVAPPRLDRWEMRAGQADREQARSTTPATQAELAELRQEITRLQASLYAATGYLRR